MERGSPDWLTSQLESLRGRFEREISGSANPLKKWFFALSLLVGALMTYASTYAEFQKVKPEFAVLRIEKIYFYYPLLALLAFLISKLMKGRDALLVSFVFTFLSLVFFSLQENFDFNFPLMIFHVGLLVCSFVVFRLIQNLKIFYKRFVAFSFFAAVFFIEIYLGSGWTLFESIQNGYPQRFLFVIYLAYINEQMSREESEKTFLQTILFPLHFLYPLPTQPYYWENPSEEQKNANQIKGLVDLFICAQLTWVLFQFQNLGPIGEKTNWQLTLLAGLKAYLIIYLYSCVAISTPVAIARILGFSLPSAYRFPLLSASPQDRWRRWNTYFYNFYCWLFYIPFFKKTKSLFLSVMLTFLLTSFFHISHSLTNNIFDTESDLGLPRTMIVFFLLHGLAVYFGLKWKSPALDGKKKIGWIGVGLTWMVMILIHSIRF